MCLSVGPAGRRSGRAAALPLLSSVMVQRDDTWGAGLTLGVGDRDNDGKAEVYVAFNSGGDTLVHVFDDGGTEVAQIDPFDGFRGAVSVALADGNNDGRATLAATSASGDVSHFRAIDMLAGGLTPDRPAGSSDDTGLNLVGSSRLALHGESSFYVPGFGQGGIEVSGR